MPSKRSSSIDDDDDEASDNFSITTCTSPAATSSCCCCCCCCPCLLFFVFARCFPLSAAADGEDIEDDDVDDDNEVTVAFRGGRMVSVLRLLGTAGGGAPRLGVCKLPTPPTTAASGECDADDAAPAVDFLALAGLVASARDCRLLVSGVLAAEALLERAESRAALLTARLLGLRGRGTAKVFFA